MVEQKYIYKYFLLFLSKSASIERYIYGIRYTYYMNKQQTFEILGLTLGNPKDEITYLSIESEKLTFNDYMDLQRLMRNL